MEILNACLFGKFHVKNRQNVELVLENGRTQELFSYLLLHHDRPQSRDVLAELFWSDTETQQAKRYLSKTLWQLRTALSKQLQVSCDALLSVEPRWIQLNADMGLWLDVAVFEKAYAKYCHADPENKHVMRLIEAIDIYQGDLLAGFYQSWCLYARERYQLMFLTMLDKLMDYYETQGDFVAGLHYGFRILQQDRARERTHRRLMRLYYLAGDRTAALRQYEQCADVLQEELGAKPGGRTEALFQKICEDSTLFLPDQIFALGTTKNLISVKKPPVCTHLQRIHAILDDTQRRIAEEIDAIEAILHP